MHVPTEVYSRVAHAYYHRRPWLAKMCICACMYTYAAEHVQAREGTNTVTQCDFCPSALFTLGWGGGAMRNLAALEGDRAVPTSGQYGYGYGYGYGWEFESPVVLLQNTCICACMPMLQSTCIYEPHPRG